MVKTLIEAMVGEDGIMRVYWVAVSEQAVMWVIGSEELATKAVEFVNGEGAGLDQDAAVNLTMQLMNPASQWSAFVSPPGCVAWVRRLLASMFAQLGAPVPAIDEYPAGPPVGFSVNLADGWLDGEMVVPKKSLEDLAAYIKTFTTK
jgi:hypothetical protein